MSPDLSPSDWLVLGALRTGGTHGFAVSTALAKDGDLGRIWSVRRPMVYQSVTKLAALGLVEEASTVRSTSGPSRTLLTVTPQGSKALDGWLSTPVEHLRDLRPLLLAKLVFLDRLGRDAAPLIHAQRGQLTALIDTPSGHDGSDTVDRLIEGWRHETARAALRFLDGA